jgi:lysyl-tRNA synthetase, class II
MSELGLDPKDLADMDVLRPKLREMLYPHMPKQTDFFNDKQLIDKLIEHKIEPKSLDHPAFIMNHPLLLSPLAKSHAQGRTQGSPLLAERFELFVNGMEVVNAYSEQNSASH